MLLAIMSSTKLVPKLSLARSENSCACNVCSMLACVYTIYVHSLVDIHFVNRYTSYRLHDMCSGVLNRY